MRRVAPNLRVQSSVRIDEVDRNWQSLVRCEQTREVIFGLLNLPVIHDLRSDGPAWPVPLSAAPSKDCLCRGRRLETSTSGKKAVGST